MKKDKIIRCKSLHRYEKFGSIFALYKWFHLDIQFSSSNFRKNSRFFIFYI